MDPAGSETNGSGSFFDESYYSPACAMDFPGTKWTGSALGSLPSAYDMQGDEARYICLRNWCAQTFPSAVALEAHYATDHRFLYSYQAVGALNSELEGDGLLALHPDVSTNNSSTAFPCSLNAQDLLSFDYTNNAQANPAVTDTTLPTGFGINRCSINNLTSASLFEYEDCTIDHAQAASLDAITGDGSDLDFASVNQRSNSGSMTPRVSDSSTNIGNDPHPILASSVGGDCECIACVVKKYLQDTQGPYGGYWSKRTCHLPDCQIQTFCIAAWKQHYGTHLKQQGRYPCKSGNCKLTFARFVDLLRHSTNIHCLNPPKFPCDVIGCKFGGDNGFVRKDKLRDHKKNVHDGKPTFAPMQRPRAIKPKNEAETYGV